MRLLFPAGELLEHYGARLALARAPFETTERDNPAVIAMAAIGIIWARARQAVQFANLAARRAAKV